MPVFKREAELSLRAPSLQMEPWSKSLTLPLPPPVVVAFEAKWGVNKSNIHCIVWHPKGPYEVTLVVQITSGHGLLAFSCSISRRPAVPHAENATQPPTTAIIQVYLHLDLSDWLNGPLFGIVPLQACLVFRPETTMQRHILFIKSRCHLTLDVTHCEDAAAEALSYVSVIISTKRNSGTQAVHCITSPQCARPAAFSEATIWNMIFIGIM